MPDVRQERTGWRDLRLSDRHRKWGTDCPGVDLDFLFLEYDRGRACLIVEYKNEYAKGWDRMNASYRALVDLGDRASLPVFLCRYANDFLWFEAVPLNDIARKWCPKETVMTEPQWVKLLYRVRGIEMPDELFDAEGIPNWPRRSI